jgi:hypothetical protein
MKHMHRKIRSVNSQRQRRMEKPDSFFLLSGTKSLLLAFISEVT